MHKAETYTRNMNLTTCNVNARGTEMGVQPDRYRVRKKGMPLCQLSLTGSTVTHLESIGIFTGERLYSLMLSSPKAMRMLFTEHGDSFDRVNNMLRCNLPPEAVARIDQAVVEDYGTGLLDEQQAM